MSRQDDLRQLISNHQRRLQKLKEQQALMGLLHTPPYISIEIEDTEAELKRLSDELAGLRGATPSREETVPALAGTQVFISYSRRDIEFVQKLAADLERAGLRTWWDVSKLAGGDIWAQTIEAALEASAYCLVVLSPDSREAKWVRKEYMYALDLGLKVIPLLCKECKIPLALHDLQYVDGRADRYEPGLRQLLSIFAPEAKPTPPPPIEKPAPVPEVKPRSVEKFSPTPESKPTPPPPMEKSAPIPESKPAPIEKLAPIPELKPSPTEESPSAPELKPPPPAPVEKPASVSKSKSRSVKKSAHTPELKPPPIEKPAPVPELKPTPLLRVVETPKKEDPPPKPARRPEEPELVLIPAGEFWMGSDWPVLEKAGTSIMREEMPRHRLYLPDYWIGRYPVTNAEYGRFIKAGGYRQRDFWTETGWQLKEQKKWTQPRY